MIKFKKKKETENENHLQRMKNARAVFLLLALHHREWNVSPSKKNK